LEFVQNNLLWVITAFVSGALLLWPLIRNRGGGDAISPVQATMMINREDAIVVDVREPNEFAQGHLPNARLIPVGQVEKRMAELEKFKERPIIVNCQTGNRSNSACSTLRKAGFSKVFSLQGGVGAWEQAGLPLTKK
jgi:rhodanese-related sulfurtransferase